MRDRLGCGCSTFLIGPSPRGAMPEEKEAPMSMDAHVAELRKKHQDLSTLIEREERSPGSDDLEVRRMKREKLRLKEQIHKLGSRPN